MKHKMHLLRNPRDTRQNHQTGERYSLSPAEGERAGVRGKVCSVSGASPNPSPWPSPLPKGRGNPLQARVVQRAASLIFRRIVGMVITTFLLLSGVSLFAAEDRATNPRPASSEQMQWFRDAKFGLFIHWGPASISGAEISWGRKDRIEAGGTELQKVPADVYDHLYQQFNPVKFNADQWMALAKVAGCRYVVFITKHHDGFSMWPTKQVRWEDPARPRYYSIAETPFKRDLCQEIAAAARKHGLKLGWYYSTRDWTHPDYLKGDNRRYNDYYEAQVSELLTRYGPVDMMWFDHAFGDWNQFTIEHLFQTMYQAHPNLLVNNRSARGLNNIPAGAMRQLTEADYDTPEQHIGQFQTNRAWESCVTMTKCRNDTGGWSYRPGEPTRAFADCLKMLVSTVTGDGNLLLNIGPMPTGEIVPEQIEVLRKMGIWLKQNGKSIYGTRGGPFVNGNWGGSTQRGNKIWLHVFEWSGDTLRLPTLERTIQSARLLRGTKVKPVQTRAGLEITLPKAQQDPVDTVIELTLAPVKTGHSPGAGSPQL